MGFLKSFFGGKDESPEEKRKREEARKAVIKRELNLSEPKIEYVDEEMKLRILEYKSKLKSTISLEEEIHLEKEYKDVIIIESQFNEFMEFVNNSQGRLPSQNSKNETEQNVSIKH